MASTWSPCFKSPGSQLMLITLDVDVEWVRWTGRWLLPWCERWSPAGFVTASHAEGAVVHEINFYLCRLVLSVVLCRNSRLTRDGSFSSFQYQYVQTGETFLLTLGTGRNNNTRLGRVPVLEGLFSRFKIN